MQDTEAVCIMSQIDQDVQSGVFELFPRDARKKIEQWGRHANDEDVALKELCGVVCAESVVIGGPPEKLVDGVLVFGGGIEREGGHAMLHAAKCADAGKGVADLGAGMGLEDSATRGGEGTCGGCVCVGEDACGELLGKEKTRIWGKRHELSFCVIAKRETVKIHGGWVWGFWCCKV